MNGVVNLYKPPKFTSHDIVNIVRRALNMKKVGHTGTLDPDAQGVLPICIGKGTRAADLLTAADKRYTATMCLGKITDTADASGKVIFEQAVNVSEEQLILEVSKFVGDIAQIPPMYSAIKQGGRKLYELARKGIEVERSPRNITIYSINILSRNGDDVVLDVHCSKGTYIRTLCEDIGKALGCGAHMKDLIRTESGDFKIDDSISLDDFKAAAEQGRAQELLTPVDKLFKHPKLFLTKEQSAMVKNGVPIYYEADENTYLVYDELENFISISRIEEIEGRSCLKLVKSFYGEGIK